jgi:SAM-dependent methyltransferase
MSKKPVNYNEVAAVYDQRYKRGEPAGIAEYLQALAGKVKARRVLEVGCGTGQWLALMQDCEGRYGLDYSGGMLAKARRKDGSLRLIQGTAMHLPFCKHAVGFVFCVHALHHFDNPATFIREAYRVIDSGGALAIIGMDPQTERDRWYLYDYFPGTYENDLGRYPSGVEILGWMKEAGFVKCDRCIVARITRNFVGGEVLGDPILQKNGTSQLALLTGEAFETGMARIRKALQEAEEDGKEIVFSTRIALPAVVGFKEKENGYGLHQTDLYLQDRR